MLAQPRPATLCHVAVAFAIGLMLAGSAAAAENLGAFEVRVDGKIVKRWDRAQVQKLPAAKFTNRTGKARTAVLLSTLLEKSGVPMDRVAAVTVTGLGGDMEKGPSTKRLEGEKGPGQTTREFRGDDVASAMGRAAFFYNVDRFWTLANLEGAERGHAPWDQGRVRKIRRIDVTLK